MDTPPPRTVSETLLSHALRDDWDLGPVSLRYVPKGAGSYHWVVECDDSRWFLTVDDLGTKPWISSGLDASFEGLGRAYRAATVLEEQHGVSMAVGSVSTRHGASLVRLSDRYGAALFPFVEGEAGRWGTPLGDAASGELVRGLVELHRADATGLDLPVRPLAVPERSALDTGLASALADAGRPWDAGPYSERARQALARSALRVEAWLEELDRLAAGLGDAGSRCVVTHGEPHPGNVIWGRRGLRLVDWDTVALSLPERDLWMLGDRSPHLLVLYEKLAGSRLSPGALRYFALEWALSDIASFTAMFRAPHEPTGWTEQRLHGYLHLLDGGSPAPYGS